jgi:UDP-glucose 4-epimerase
VDQSVVPDDFGPDLKAAVADATAVIHLAGANEVRFDHDPDDATADTLATTRAVAEAVRDAGVPRLVYLSTVHVYGAAMTPGTRLTEDTLPSPRNLYAVARLACEHVCAATTASSQTDLVVFRLTNAVGAPADVSVDRWSLLANDLCRQAITTGRVELRTHGAQWRDFVAMADVGRIIGSAVGLARPASVPSGTYNLGSGHSMRVRALAELVQTVCEETTGRRPSLAAPALPASPPDAYTVSIARLTGLGLTPTTPIRCAVEETVEFCRQHKGSW